jgi:steroid 5-alpha reductase family enzyme
MSFTSMIIINLLIALGGMFCLWIVSVVVKDASIVDPCWGLGFVVIAWATIWQTGWQDLRDGLLVILVTAWGLRLSGYLFLRNRNKGEDRRYAAMREKHGSNFWWVSFLTVFMLQGVLMWFISLTFQSGIFHSGVAQIGWLGGVGVLVWIVGFIFESVGDFQMARFKSNPDNAGKVMDRGLWRYTRHPNYFGDFCVWWGLFLIASSAHSWWTIVCPALMSFFLMNVSGVSMLESDISDRRPDYETYKKTTSAFFPMPAASPSK